MTTYREDSRAEEIKALTARLTHANNLLRNKEARVVQLEASNQSLEQQIRETDHTRRDRMERIVQYSKAFTALCLTVSVCLFSRGCMDSITEHDTQEQVEAAARCSRVCELSHAEVLTCRAQWVSCIDDTHVEGHQF